MELFNTYLPLALEAAKKKFPGEDLQLYNGEYRPNIDNFHYEYNFASPNTGVKVIVNTSPGGIRFLVTPTPNHFTSLLAPVAMPVDYTLTQAYNQAAANGYQPNLLDGFVFLQDLRVTPGAAYWFLQGNSNTEWILVQVEEPHTITESSKLRPVMPG